MKRGPFLLDTGFLVALVNASDPAHAACVHTWKQVQGPFVSSEGVLVETAWLLRKVPGAFRNAYALTRRTSTIFVAPSPWRYQRSLELMERYRDVPMDLVDAVLVAISEELETHDVLTLDVRGFSAYRSGSKAFRLHPPSRA